jgi:hypothetical protein
MTKLWTGHKSVTYGKTDGAYFYIHLFLWKGGGQLVGTHNCVRPVTLSCSEGFLNNLA